MLSPRGGGGGGMFLLVGVAVQTKQPAKVIMKSLLSVEASISARTKAVAHHSHNCFELLSRVEMAGGGSNLTKQVAFWGIKASTLVNFEVLGAFIGARCLFFGQYP